MICKPVGKLIPHCISSDQSEILEQVHSNRSQALARSASQELELSMMQYQLPYHAHPPTSYIEFCKTRDITRDTTTINHPPMETA